MSIFFFLCACMSLGFCFSIKHFLIVVVIEFELIEAPLNEMNDGKKANAESIRHFGFAISK